MAHWLGDGLALGGGPGPLAWWETLSSDGQRVAAYLGIALLGVAVLAGVVLTQHRQLQRLTSRVDRLQRLLGPLDGLSVGAPAPRLTLPTLAGVDLSLDALLAPGRTVALVFLSPGCDHCAALARELPEFHPHVPMAIVTRRGVQELGSLPLDRVLLQEAFEVGERFRLDAVPTVVVVDPGPVIASLPVTGVSPVSALLRELAAGRGVPEWARVREPE
jgi:hypothetical protein